MTRAVVPPGVREVVVAIDVAKASIAPVPEVAEKERYAPYSANPYFRVPIVAELIVACATDS